MARRRRRHSTEDNKESKTSSKQSDEKVIDFAAVWAFCKGLFSKKSDKPYQKYAFLLLLLIPFTIGFTIRMQTAYLPIMDDHASANVINFYREQIAQQVRGQYPTLPEANRQNIVTSQFVDFQKQNAGLIEQQIAANANELRSHFQDDNGYTWAPDIDSYFYLRGARNYLEHGHTGDEVLGKPGFKYLDNHMLAPIGAPIANTEAHGVMLAFMYRIIKIFEPGATLMYGASFFPVVMACLGIILVFFLAYLYSGPIGGTAAATLYATSFAMLNRTLFGHVDTDAYNIVLPVLAALCAAMALRAKGDMKKSLIWGGLTGLSIGLFEIFWQGGWWFMFDFILLSFVAVIVYMFFTGQKKELKRCAYIFLAFYVVTGIVVTLDNNLNTFLFTPLEPISFISIKDVAGGSTIWPNVLTTVAELNETDMQGIIGNLLSGLKYPEVFLFIGFLGLILVLYLQKVPRLIFWASLVWYFLAVSLRHKFSNIVFYAAVIGIPVAAALVMALLRAREEKKLDNVSPSRIFFSVLLLIWMAGGLYASTKGIRFVLLFAPAFVIAVGIAFDWMYKELARVLNDMFSVPENLTKIIGILIIAFLLYTPVQNAYSLGRQDVPNANDAWVNSLYKIKDNSSQTAIITSWWDFGHWFKFYADRPVTFDGASQNTPRAHWVGKLFLTGSEEESIGILRMLDCGGNTAAEELDKEVGDLALTVPYLNEIIVLDKRGAIKALEEKGISKETMAKVIKNTHCESPPEAFVIASGDMVGKSGVWGHFGAWDFDRALMVNLVKTSGSVEAGVQALQDRFNYTKEQADQLYWEIEGADPNQWIAPWPSYITGFNNCQEEEDKTICRNSIGSNSFEMEVDPDGEYYVSINVPGGGKAPIRRVGVVTEEGIDVYDYPESAFPYGVLIAPNGDGGYKNMMMYAQLVDSVFTKMFYLSGHGLRYFDVFGYERSITGLEIYTYKVDWEGKDLKQVFFVEPEVAEEETEADSTDDSESSEETEAQADEEETEEE